MTEKTTKKTPANAAIAKEIGAYITQLPSASPGQRKRLIGTVTTILYPHFQNWAPRLCKVHGDVYGGHVGDIVSVIAERVLKKLAEVTEEKPHTSVANWYSYLYATARYAALAYFQSTAVTPASGMTTAMRRQRHAAATRSKLRMALGREPEDHEVIESANADMLKRRSNAAKQGVLITETDLEPLQPALDIDDHQGGAAYQDDEALLAPVEAAQLIALIVEDCTSESAVLGSAATSWLGSLYAEVPSIGTPKEVAMDLDVDLEEAAELMDLVRERAQELCISRFGIQFPGLGPKPTAYEELEAAPLAS